MDKNESNNQTLLDDIKTLVTCYICYDILKDPLKCSICETSFCNKCINNWYLKTKQCPLKCQNTQFLPSCKLTRYLIEKFRPKFNEVNTICNKEVNNAKKTNNDVTTSLTDKENKEKNIVKKEDDSIPINETDNIILLNQNTDINLNTDHTTNKNIDKDSDHKKQAFNVEQIKLDNELLTKQNLKLQISVETLKKQLEIIQKENDNHLPSFTECNYLTQPKQNKCSYCSEENWYRSKQEKTYCIKCMPITIIDHKCPLGHKIEQLKLGKVSYLTQITCDICFKDVEIDEEVNNQFNVDSFCNITICDDCFNNLP